MEPDPDAVFAALRRHRAQEWPGVDLTEHRHPVGPVEEALPRFRVHRLDRRRPGGRTTFTYLSLGAFQADPAMMREFHLTSPVASDLHVELLSMVAYFHADPRYRLDHGSTLDIGRPWLPGAGSRHLFVAFPYDLAPEQAFCAVAEQHVQQMWLIPITPAEFEFVQVEGVEPFEQRLEQSGVDTLDPGRPSVV